MIFLNIRNWEDTMNRSLVSQIMFSVFLLNACNHLTYAITPRGVKDIEINTIDLRIRGLSTPESTLFYNGSIYTADIGGGSMNFLKEKDFLLKQHGIKQKNYFLVN